MRLLPTLTAALVVASLLAGAVPAPAAGQQDQVTLTITVETPEGEPVSNADATVEWVGGNSTETTRSNGQALVDVPRGADVTIRVDHPFLVRNRPAKTNAGDGDAVTVTVYREGSVSLTVVDEAGGGPVANAQVFLSKKETTFSGRTGQDGRFTTDVIEQGTYRYSIRKSGYFDASGTITVDGDVEPELEIEQGQVPVEFQVVDPHFDPPRAVSDARVQVGSLASVNTSGSGLVSIGVPVNSQYDVRVTKPGYEAATRSLAVEESGERIEFSISRIPELELTADNDRILVGQRVRIEVVDEYDAPVEGAAVLVNGTTVGETNADGVLRVEIETVGVRELVARHDGVESDSVILEGVEAATETTTTETTTATTTETTTTTTETTTATTAATTTSSQFGPGFGPVAALAALALVAAALLAARRR